MYKTTQFKVVRTYRVFIKNNSQSDKMMLNLKMSTNGDIFCKVKKFGIVLYQVHLKRKNYQSSVVFKFSRIPYDDIIKFLCDEEGRMNVRIEDFEVFIDNKEKVIKAEQLIYGRHDLEVLST